MIPNDPTFSDTTRGGKTNPWSISQRPARTYKKTYIPRHVGEAGKEQNKNSNISIIGGYETVLPVEDNRMLLKMVKEMFERVGPTVLPAGDPTEAVKSPQSTKRISVC